MSSPFRPPQQAVVIDLCSSSDEEAATAKKESQLDDSTSPIDDFYNRTDDTNNDFHLPIQRPETPLENDRLSPGNSYNLEENDWALDDAWEAILAVPDVDAPPDNPPQAQHLSGASNEDIDPSSAVLTEQKSLALVLQIFPDISHDHVLELLRRGESNGAYTEEWCHMVINSIADDAVGYPKERDRVRELKRKRRGSHSDCEASEESVQPSPSTGTTPKFVTEASRLLGIEFAEIPLPHIASILRQEKSPYHAYLKLNSQRDQQPPPFKKLKQARQPNSSSAEPANHNEVFRMIERARKKIKKLKTQVDAKRDQERQEEENERQARATGAVQECGCCYTEFPLNRMVSCNNDDSHFFCYDCVSNYIRSEIGEGKCNPVCMDTSGCGKQGGKFVRSGLLKALRGDVKTLDKLEQMQQAEDIRLAAIDGLEQCPFCDFQAEYPPVEVDREFRCVNADCAKTSCRLCRAETHVPKTCEEYAKDNTLTHRHQLEEALTEALTRKCNKCKKTFLKDSGCNKITCPTCQNRQCYCCGKDVHDYNHFAGHSGPANVVGKCPLYDNTEERHANDVEKAKKNALEKLRAENPALTEDDLKIKMSDKVEQADKKRMDDAVRRQAIRRGAYEEVHGFGVPGHPNQFGGVEFQQMLQHGFGPVHVPYPFPAPNANANFNPRHRGALPGLVAAPNPLRQHIEPYELNPPLRQRGVDFLAVPPRPANGGFHPQTGTHVQQLVARPANVEPTGRQNNPQGHPGRRPPQNNPRGAAPALPRFLFGLHPGTHVGIHVGGRVPDVDMDIDMDYDEEDEPAERQMLERERQIRLARERHHGIMMQEREQLMQEQQQTARQHAAANHLAGGFQQQGQVDLRVLQEQQEHLWEGLARFDAR